MQQIQLTTIFNLMTAYTPISAQSSIYIVFRLQPDCTFCLLLYKGICCGYPFELHQLVDAMHQQAIRMSTHNAGFYKENLKEKKNNIKISHKHHY